MKRILLRLFRNTGGATAIEYALLAALIAVLTIPALVVLGPQISATYERVAAAMGRNSSGGDTAITPGPGITPDHVITRNINFYWSDSFQDWFVRPTDISADDWNNAQFTLTGDGNPRASTSNDGFAAEGRLGWDGVTLRFDTPAPGETAIIDLELPNHTVRYVFTRDSSP